MNKFVWILLAALVMAAPLSAQNSESEDAAREQQENQAPERAQAPPPPKQRNRAPSSFSPSEKIRADTSVAFPADI